MSNLAVYKRAQPKNLFDSGQMNVHNEESLGQRSVVTTQARMAAKSPEDKHLTINRVMTDCTHSYLLLIENDVNVICCLREHEFNLSQ